MSTHPNAGKPAPKDILIDVSRLEAAFYEGKPDPADPNQLVSFGTSGHRGTSSNATFTEAHILAIAQAICEYRRSQGITGPLFMGKDTHALSRPAERVALEVLAGRKQGRNIYSARRRFHADSGHFALHPWIQPGSLGRTCGRHRCHPFAQPANRRRFQIQSTERRTGRHRRHRLDSKPRERAAPRR